MNTEKILTYVSLAARGRDIVTGGDRVINRVRRGGKMCVILASDASDRTAKQIGDKCAYYKVSLIRLPDTDMEALGHRCGNVSPAAAVCVTNASLAKEIEKWLGE